MTLLQQFNDMWGKAIQASQQLQKAECELHFRYEAYKDEGRDFARKAEEQLQKSVGHWRRLRTSRSVKLLALCDQLTKGGHEFSKAFDRKTFEEYSKG